MNPRLFAFPVVLLCLLPACSKQAAQKKTGETAQETPKPRGNSAEALGFASESSEGYLQSNPAPAAAPALRATTAPATVRRKLTAKDGRSVEAELLAGNGEAVKIRRSADSTEFTIPLTELSEADRDFIRRSALPPLAAP